MVAGREYACLWHSGFGSNLTRIELFDVKTHQISQLPGSLRLLSALGVVLGAIGWVGGGDRARARDVEVANLAAHSAEANAALVRGDIGTYLALIEHANDYTLMAPFGGLTHRLHIGQRWLDSSSPARCTKRS